MCLAIGFHAVVEVTDLLHGIGNLGTPLKHLGRQRGAENDLYAVGTRHVDHRQHVTEGVVLVISACVLSDVVGAIVDDHNTRFEVYDVLTEAEQKLV